MKSLNFILILLCIAFFNLNTAMAQEKNTDKVFEKVDKMPEYPGGLEALMTEVAQNVTYPVEAKKNKVEGKVFVSFIIDEMGKVTNAKVQKGVDPQLDNEALRVVKLLKDWTPAQQDNQNVKVSMVLPVKFALN